MRIHQEMSVAPVFYTGLTMSSIVSDGERIYVQNALDAVACFDLGGQANPSLERILAQLSASTAKDKVKPFADRIRELMTE